MSRIVIADDHQLLRESVRLALEAAGHTVLAEASDGEELVRCALELRPDVVVVDVSMPVLDGIEATRRLRAAWPEVPIVILTMHGEERLKAEAVRAGATAFLTKDCSMREVVATVDATADPDVDLNAEVASSILGDAAVTPTAPESPLTKRETEILQLVADGLSTSEVGERLYISAKTVKNHLAAVYQKLDARDRTQAVLSGVRIGIIRLG